MWGRYRDNKAKHIADIYQNEIHPEEYLSRERKTRNDKIKEVAGCIMLGAFVILSLLLWYAYEGFSVMW